ncbi:MAG: chemoreceptor glutamine deamidase CheD [Gammaproteobacteria bacterium]
MATISERAASTPRPDSVPGFQRVQRFWDANTARWTARVLPGEFYVTRSDEAVTTVLGSCISACIRDPELNVGGINHFMLPENAAGASVSGDRWLDPENGLATRYGSHAMESLINELLKLGASRRRFEIKVFGAGRILASDTDVGSRNIAFVRAYLSEEGLSTLAEDLGGICPRRIVLFSGDRKGASAQVAPARCDGHRGSASDATLPTSILKAQAATSSCSTDPVACRLKNSENEHASKSRPCARRHPWQTRACADRR